MKITDIKIFHNSFGDTLTDPCKTANLLNYKLATMGDFNYLYRYTHDEQIRSPPITNTRIRFDNRYVTSKEVLDTNRQLNRNMPFRPTQVAGWALRDAASCIHILLSFIIKNAIEMQKFPNDLRRLKSRPFSKKVKQLTLLTTDPYSSHQH